MDRVLPRHAVHAVSCGIGLLAQAAMARADCPASWLANGFVDAPLNGQVLAFAEWDADGPGGQAPVLFAAGAFPVPGSAGNIAQWDGSSWAPVGAGLNGMVLALCVFDEDENGPAPAALFAGGSFAGAGLEYLAKWNGISWTHVADKGGGIDGTVNALLVHDVDGPGVGGASLVAGGGFATAGSHAVNGIASWNGSSWSALGDGTDGSVIELISMPNGHLVAGGWFTTAGGQPANYVAEWDGEAWWPLGNGVGSLVQALCIYDPDGPGAQPSMLAVGGDFYNDGFNRIALWDGAGWTPLGVGVTNSIFALTTFDLDGAGSQPPSLIVGGNFADASGVPVDNIARWDGSMWHPMGSISTAVVALEVLSDGRLLAGATSGWAAWSAPSFKVEQGLPVVCEIPSSIVLDITGDPVLSYEWFVDGAPLTTGNPLVFSPLKGGPQYGEGWYDVSGAKQHIHMETGQSRVLECRITSTTGVCVLESSLVLATEPGALSAPISQTACPFGQVMFQSQIPIELLVPPFSVFWTFDGEQISDGETWTGSMIESTLSPEGLATLTVSNVGPFDQGPYACAISHPGGSAASSSAQLTVCATDLTCDGSTGIGDLLSVIGGWGVCNRPCTAGVGSSACLADLNRDCVVGIADLLAVIGAWGPCP